MKSFTNYINESGVLGSFLAGARAAQALLYFAQKIFSMIHSKKEERKREEKRQFNLNLSAFQLMLSKIDVDSLPICRRYKGWLETGYAGIEPSEGWKKRMMEEIANAIKEKMPTEEIEQLEKELYI